MKQKKCFESEDIEEALQTWQEGGLVAIPTETVYGLGAPIDNLNLIKSIFAYKERPLYDPLIVHIGSIEQAKECTTEWSSLAQMLAEKFWPGPLTLVLPKNDNIDALITSGLDTVGLRCPQNKKTIKLLKRIGVGVAAPSANKFTKTSPTSKDHVFEAFRDHHLCILVSSEPCDVGIESTIVKVNGESSLEILRPGVITQDDLSKVCPNIPIQLGFTAREEIEKVTSPGQDKVHYRPNYPLYYSFGTSFSDSSAEIVKLDINPYVAARSLYSEMLKPLSNRFNKRVFLLPESFDNFSQRDKEVWQSLLNRLEKAAKSWESP